MDATVTGADRKPVRDLAADDFELLQDGRPQDIVAASFIDYGLRKFVASELAQGNLICILRTSGGGGNYQSCTSDPRQPGAIVDRIRWRPAEPDTDDDEPLMSGRSGPRRRWSGRSRDCATYPEATAFC